jgi:hypothetical protein
MVRLDGRAQARREGGAERMQHGQESVDSSRARLLKFSIARREGEEAGNGDRKILLASSSSNRPPTRTLSVATSIANST